MGRKGEYVRALFVKKWLEESGLKATRYDIPDSRVAEVFGKPDDGYRG